MAVLTAPLFSFGAAGKLGGALVYFPWKGLKVVRSYVIPANPQTSAQTTQRTRMTDAVQEWHDESYSVADVSAWNRLAGIAAKIMSGFNRMVQIFIDEDILGSTWEPINTMVASAVGANGFQINVTKISAGNIPNCLYGLTPTALLTTVALVDQTGNDWEVTLAGLTPNTLYYFQLVCGATGVDWGQTGIYTQRTTA